MPGRLYQPQLFLQHYGGKVSTIASLKDITWFALFLLLLACVVKLLPSEGIISHRHATAAQTQVAQTLCN